MELISTLSETFRYAPLETFRDFILFASWIILLLSSTLLFYAAVKIYHKLGKIVYGRLILATTIGYVLTSFSLGFVASKYILENIESYTIVFPVFLLWGAVTFLITWVVQKWDGEAIQLHKLQKDMESLVIERTAELEKVNARLLEMDEKIRMQNKHLRTAKDSAEEQEEQIETMVQSIGDGVMVVDEKGRIQLFNPMAEELSGYRKEEVLGKNYAKILRFVARTKSGSEKPDQFIEKAMEKKKVTQMSPSTILFQKSGNPIDVADSAAPIFDSNGKVSGCIVVFRDDTKRRKSEQMKTEFVSLVSHQLKTPLTAIRWGMESLEQSIGADLNMRQRMYLNDTKDSVSRLIHLVNDLLNVSRIESGRIKVNPENKNIQKIVKKVVDEIRPIAKAKAINVTLKRPTKTIKMMPLDEPLIFQVIHNLVANAVRYTNPQGHVEVFLKDLGKNGVEIHVKDDGIGIPKEEQSSLFNKFYRAENAMKAVTDGNGLGLYLVKMILDVSGGKIEFESQEDVGTEFVVTIPKTGMKKHKGVKGIAK